MCIRDSLIDNMIETLREANGVGLAAPQVGQPIQLAVILTLPEEDDEGNEIEDTRELFVIINPEIFWRSKETTKGIEGCLSIPGYVGEVERHESIRVRGQDRHGRKLRLRLYDWTARIFQHEIDHLNGELYIEMCIRDRVMSVGQWVSRSVGQWVSGSVGQ